MSFYFLKLIVNGQEYALEAHTPGDVLAFVQQFQSTGDQGGIDRKSPGLKLQITEAMHGLALGQASWGMWEGAADCYHFLGDVLAQLGNDPIGNTQKTAPTDNAVKLDWKMRHALRQASEKPTIWRDRRTKRGVEQLVQLGLLRMVKETDTRRIYEITDSGRLVAPMLPTDDQEWQAMATDELRDFSVTLPTKGGDVTAQSGT